MSDFPNSIGKRPYITGDSLREAFRRYDRDPFHDMAASLYEDFFKLSEADRMAWIRKRPETAIASLLGVARMAGYTEKQEVLHTHTLDLSKLSDSQLEDRVRQGARALLTQTTFIEAVVVPENEPEVAAEPSHAQPRAAVDVDSDDPTAGLTTEAIEAILAELGGGSET